MTEFIDLLEKKLDSNNPEEIERLNHQLSEFGCDLSANQEAGILIQMANDGHYPQEKIYDFLYKFTEFYSDDSNYLMDFVVVIMYCVSEDMLDPIVGSRLIGSMWANLGYYDELTDFIGAEGELEYHDNRLKSNTLNDRQKVISQEKIAEIRKNLKSLAKTFLENNTI